MASLQTRLSALITAIGADIKAKANLDYTVVTKTADYTLQDSDRGTYIRMNKSSAAVLTAPVIFAGSFNVKIFNASAFDVTITPSSTTATYSTGLKIPAKRGVEIIYTASNAFDVVGTLSA
jgi:hypothetical protein